MRNASLPVKLPAGMVWRFHQAGAALPLAQDDIAHISADIAATYCCNRAAQQTGARA
jgi:hypothetical protein